MSTNTISFKINPGQDAKLREALDGYSGRLTTFAGRDCFKARTEDTGKVAAIIAEYASNINIEHQHVVRLQQPVPCTPYNLGILDSVKHEIQSQLEMGFDAGCESQARLLVRKHRYFGALYTPATLVGDEDEWEIQFELDTRHAEAKPTLPISMMREVREWFGWGLHEAKDYIMRGRIPVKGRVRAQDLLETLTPFNPKNAVIVRVAKESPPAKDLKATLETLAANADALAAQIRQVLKDVYP